MTFSVLMVCTGNICRSPMAAGLLTHTLPGILKPQVNVGSAGTHGLHGNRAEPYAVKTAGLHGADIHHHRARILDRELVRSADLILAMEKYHLECVNRLFLFRCKYARLIGSFAADVDDPEIDDPYGLPMDAYEATAVKLLKCMPGVIQYIRERLELPE